ncbi:MAG: glycosyltransferase [Bacteroidota bacterium]|jgi:glycosyltransferase involved in cell wall biosynthesis
MNRAVTKVIHIVSDLSMGGVSNVVYDLVKNYKSSHYSYSVINLSGRGDSSVIQKFSVLGIEVVSLNYTFQNGFSLLDYCKEAFFQSGFKSANSYAIQKIVSLKPDILHFHTLPRELILGREVCKKHQCKLYHTDHLVRLTRGEGSWISRLLIRIPFAIFYSGFHVVAVSNAVKDYLQYLWIDKFTSGLTVIGNKISSSDFRIKYEPKTELKVVYVARVSHVKGHSDLIHAWSRIPRSGMHLYVVGPDELGGEMQRLVDTLACENPVTFTGSIPDASDFIKDADIGVFPSHQEGLPLALLEKLRIGIPCVVSNIPELTSIINNDKNGIVYPCGDVAALADAIIRLSSDMELRSRLGSAAAEKINTLYVSRLGGIDKEYEELYNGSEAKANS